MQRVMLKERKRSVRVNAVTFIKYNLKTTMVNTAVLTERKIQSHIYKRCQIFFREARIETR